MPRPVPEDQAVACWVALCELLEFFNGNRALASREIGVASACVHQWVKRGAVGAIGALRIDHNPNLPFTKEMLRPDRTEREWRACLGQYDRDWMLPCKMRKREQSY